jgi:hypothetical protein
MKEPFHTITQKHKLKVQLKSSNLSPANTNQMTSIQAEDVSNSVQLKGIRMIGNKSQLNVRIKQVRRNRIFNKTNINTPTKK